MIEVVCAVILNQSNEVFVAQRSSKMEHPFRWEFPGGKIEAGESPADALLREIKEELNMELFILHSLDCLCYKYPDKEICLYPFLCISSGDSPQLSEHSAYRWLNLIDMESLDLLEADKPILEQLKMHSLTSGRFRFEKPEV